VKKDDFAVGTHNGECGGEVRKPSGGKRTVTMGGVGGKTVAMYCLKCNRVVPDEELVKK